MKNDKLVYTSEKMVDGENYKISVYCRLDGRHYAKTFLNDSDIIINDGTSLAEVLKKHEDLLPLAVTSHKARIEMRYQTSSFKERA